METTIIVKLKEAFETEKKKHEYHLVRVQKMLDWWATIVRENGKRKENSFMGSMVEIDGKKGRCVATDLRGTPHYSVTLTFRPLSDTETIGESEPGGFHLVSF